MDRRIMYSPLENGFYEAPFTIHEGVQPEESTFKTLLGDIIKLPKYWTINEEGIPITGNQQTAEEEQKQELMINTNNPETPVETQQQSQQFTGTFKSKNKWAFTLAQAYRNLGVSENGIKNLIAKNALESNWGKSVQGRFNYGNITVGSSWKGDYVNGHDHDAKGNLIRSKFRSYNSLEEYAQDEIKFLKRLYDFDDTDDINTFLDKLQGKNKGGRRYAESPKYKSAVKGVYNSI